MIPFFRPSVGEEEIEALARVVRSGFLTPGPETRAFEQEFAEYVGCKYAIFTNSCTSALKMAYKYFKEYGHGFYQGQLKVNEVYYPKNTFCATYSAAEELGLKTEVRPELIGKGMSSLNVNMHYGGVKDETPWCSIEDSAHRIEPNDPLIGKIRCYSFHGSKNMTTNGAGGMFVTDDKEIYERARLYWRDGLSTSTEDRINGNPFYEVETFSGGYDATDGAAAFGRVQLKRLPAFTARRNDLRDRYNKAFQASWGGNHLYCYFLDSLEQVGPFIAEMRNRNVDCKYHYPNTGWKGVSLPIYPTLTDDEVSYIIGAVHETTKVLSNS